jgi:hypothetical protein
MAHTRTVEAVERILSADPEQKEAAERESEVLLSALSILEKFADKPAPAAPDVHVYVPEREVTVEAPQIQVDVAAPPAPPPLPAPQIDVHVPQLAPPKVEVAAPEVHVAVPAPEPRTIRVEEDEDGNRRYVQE